MPNYVGTFSLRRSLSNWPSFPYTFSPLPFFYKKNLFSKILLHFLQKKENKKKNVKLGRLVRKKELKITIKIKYVL